MKKSLNLADKVKKARREAGLSQKQLGEKMGLSDKAISSYEVGRAMPTVKTLRELSTITYKPLAYFLNEGEEEEMNLQIKIQTIERELTEIKKILRKKNS